jgi:putative hydrolase of the HAD superfamily
MIENIETVIFDFDGTLDTNGIPWEQKYLITLKTNEFIFDEKLYYRIFKASKKFLINNSNNNSYIYKELVRDQLSLIISNIHLFGYEDKHSYERIIKDVFADLWMEINYCIKNSKEILESLKKKYKLGLVSNYYGNIKEICSDLDLNIYFNAILDSNTLEIQKPHPGIFSIALEELNALPERTIVISDSYEEDIVPSKIVGCNTIWLNKCEIKDISKYDSADYIIRNINMIKEILKK